MDETAAPPSAPAQAAPAPEAAPPAPASPQPVIAAEPRGPSHGVYEDRHTAYNPDVEQFTDTLFALGVPTEVGKAALAWLGSNDNDAAYATQDAADVSGKPPASFPRARAVRRMPASTTDVERTRWKESSAGAWAREHGGSCWPGMRAGESRSAPSADARA